ncbi:hypothetical protein TNCV_2082971 [Trichonephila clavipes]|nr:hypothetical protein TNCV_2082971 [Trichonephila clavipes]
MPNTHIFLKNPLPNTSSSVSTFSTSSSSTQDNLLPSPSGILPTIQKYRHPTVKEIIILLRKLERKGFDIIFSWVPGHVGLFGNQQADTAARSMSDHMQQPVCYRDIKLLHRTLSIVYGKRLRINRSSTNCIAFILPLLIGQHYQCEDMMSARLDFTLVILVLRTSTVCWVKMPPRMSIL